MLTSISPLGERSRGNRWSATFMWLLMGSVAGGALLGAALGAVGLLIPGQVDDGWRLIVLAVAGLAAAAWDLSGRRLPGWRQVNEDWLTAFRSWVYGSGFGFQLGVAVATVVYTALVPVFMLAAVLADGVLAGLMIGASFGVARGLSVMINRRVQNSEELASMHRRLDGFSESSRRLGAGVAALLSGAAALSAVVS